MTTHSASSQLSLEIEDSVKSLQILEEKFTMISQLGEAKQKELAAKYRDDFKALAKKCKDEMEEKIELCNQHTEKKRTLASELKGLQGKLKLAEDRIALAVKKIAEDGETELGEAAATWGEGEIVRREKWIEKKTKEIREITIKGLEPEVQRIIDSHKVNCDNVERELEEMKKEWLAEWSKTVEEEKDKVAKEGMRKYDEKIKNTRWVGLFCFCFVRAPALWLEEICI